MASFRDSSSSLPAECREIPQAPGPEKGVLALLAMDPATYMSQAVAFGVTEDFSISRRTSYCGGCFWPGTTATSPWTSFP